MKYNVEYMYRWQNSQSEQKFLDNLDLYIYLFLNGKHIDLATIEWCKQVYTNVVKIRNSLV